MLRFTFPRGAALCLALVLAACGESPMGASEGASAPPADAPVSAPPGPDLSGDFDLVGTEPFWAGKIRRNGLSLTRAGQAEVSAANPGVKIEGGAGAWNAGALVLKLRAEPCSDGMSDHRYSYRAEVTLDGQTLRGCAAAPDQPPTEPRPQ
jgi:uncharacterized membrane protein